MDTFCQFQWGFQFIAADDNSDDDDEQIVIDVDEIIFGVVDNVLGYDDGFDEDDDDDDDNIFDDVLEFYAAVKSDNYPAYVALHQPETFSYLPMLSNSTEYSELWDEYYAEHAE